MPTIEEIIKDPQRRKKEAKKQEELREKMGARLPQSAPHSNYSIGLAREQTAVDGLEGLKGEIEAGQIGEIAARDREHHLRAQLGEGYALQGLFSKAIEVTTNARHKAEYELKAAAMKKIGRMCKCPETVTVPSATDAKGEVRETKRKTDEIYWKGRVLAFYLCDSCGTVSAKYVD